MIGICVAIQRGAFWGPDIFMDISEQARDDTISAWSDTNLRGQKVWEMYIEDACACRNQDFIDQSTKQNPQQCNVMNLYACGITMPDAL